MNTKNKDTAVVESFAKIISKDHSVLEDLDPSLINDKAFIIALLNIDGLIFDTPYLPKTVRDNEEVVLAAVSQNPKVFRSHWLNDKWKRNKQVALAVLRHDGEYLEHMADSLKRDKDVVLTAIKSYPDAIEWASTKLRNDRELALLAVTKEPSTISYISSDLQDDTEIVLIAISASGNYLKYASARLRNDKQVVLMALNNEPDSDIFPYINVRLQNNREVVLTAVKNNPWILKSVFPEFRNDKEIVHAALTLPGMLLYASDNLRNDLDTVLTALYYSRDNAEYISDKLQSHPAVKFVLSHPKLRESLSWPIIKRALIEQPKRFLNPPAIIKELARDLDNKYFIYAQHALSESMVIEKVALPELDCGV